MPTLKQIGVGHCKTLVDLTWNDPIPWIFFIIYTLLKVGSHCDLNILSMPVIGFQNKVWIGGGVSCSRFFLDVLNLFNFKEPLSTSDK